MIFHISSLCDLYWDSAQRVISHTTSVVACEISKVSISSYVDSVSISKNRADDSFVGKSSMCPLIAVIDKHAIVVAEIHCASIVLGTTPILNTELIGERVIIGDDRHEGLCFAVLPSKA